MKKITSKDHKVNALLQTDIQQLRKCPDIVSHVWLLDLILSITLGIWITQEPNIQKQDEYSTFEIFAKSNTSTAP